MQAWEKFLKMQEKEVGRDAVRRWLRSLHVVDYDAGNLYLEAKDSFHVLWFEEHIRPKLGQQLVSNSRRPIQVHLSINGESATKVKKAKPKASSSSKEFQLQFDEPDPLCKFEHFVVTEGNLLSHKILCELAGQPLSADTSAHSDSQLAVFNPIYVFGGRGVGKGGKSATPWKMLSNAVG